VVARLGWYASAPPPATATPGQAAREAFGELGADWYPGTPWNGLHEDLRAQWEAAAQAAIDAQPPSAAPELAAAMAETRAVRDGYQQLCGEFGPSAQSGWSARISLTVLNRHLRAAGLAELPRTAASGDREDITLRYRRERDEAREQAEQTELERNEARDRLAATQAHRDRLNRELATLTRELNAKDREIQGAADELATCRERNAAIGRQLDQYRDERDSAREQLAIAVTEVRALRALAAEIIGDLEHVVIHGDSAYVDRGMIADFRERAGLEADGG
jgi:hypothetical protein